MTDAILLINLGSPASTAVADVRAYLDEFLMDPYVLDVPRPIRRLIVSGFILPRRPKKTAAAYATIWQDDGSPLLRHTRAMAPALEQRTGLPVAWAMRYGQPDIAAGLSELARRGATRVLVAPLYPQYAMSTSKTSFVAASAAHQQLGLDNMRLAQLPPFHGHPAYIDAMAQVARPSLEQPWDHVLFSYHGLPERHLRKTDPTGNHCLRADNCCADPSPAHATCYRQQALATSQALVEALDIPTDRWSHAWQSRLGRGWLTPYTDEVLLELAGKGVRRLVVCCPAFVADNLETLEEIGEQGREAFLEAGGEELRLVPCLNSAPVWVDALASITGEALANSP